MFVLCKRMAISKNMNLYDVIFYKKIILWRTSFIKTILDTLYLLLEDQGAFLKKNLTTVRRRKPIKLTLSYV